MRYKALMTSLEDIKDLDFGDGHKSIKEKAPKRVIICVDDNFLNLNSFKIMLGMLGYKGEI